MQPKLTLRPEPVKKDKKILPKRTKSKSPELRKKPTNNNAAKNENDNAHPASKLSRAHSKRNVRANVAYEKETNKM